MKRIILFILMGYLIVGCSDGNSKKESTDTIENQPTTNVPTPDDNIDDSPILSDKLVQGRVVDGEISGATVFLDINKNGNKDVNEPFTTSDEQGFYRLKISASLAEDYSIPVVAYGGKDIRLNSDFGEVLMALRDKDNSKSTIITPLSTLVTQDVFQKLKENETKGKIKSKISIDELFALVEQSQEKIADIFDIDRMLLNQDPVEMALSGNLDLLKTNMKINQVVKEMKKAIKDDVNSAVNSAVESYKALTEALNEAQKSANEGDELLAEAINYIAEVAPELFQPELIPTLKAVTSYTLEELDKSWEENQADIIQALQDEKEFSAIQNDISSVEDAIKNSDQDGDGLPDNTDFIAQPTITTPTDTTPPLITLNGEEKINIILGDSYIEQNATATDNINGEVDVIVDSSNLNIGKIGEYKVLYKAEDKSGNIAQKERVVRVLDPEILIENLDIIDRVCDSFSNLPIENSYTLSNNDWGKDRLTENEEGKQCIFTLRDNEILKSGWYWGWSNGEGGVKAYPEAIYGKKFSNQINLEGILPQRVQDLGSINIDVSYQDSNITGQYNIALESWLHKTNDSSMDDIRYEVMVRFDPNGFYPSSNLLFADDVVIDNIHYRIFKEKNLDNPDRYFYNFVAKEKITDIQFDFKHFLDYLKENDPDTCSDMDELYYNDIEMGVEIINGRGVLILEKFNVNIAQSSNFLLEEALKSGDASSVDLSTLYNAINSDDQLTLDSCDEQTLFFYSDGKEPVTPFDGSVDHFISKSLNNIPLHGGTEDNGSLTFYSFAGEKRSGGRYAILGSSIAKLKSEMKDSTTQLFKWLTRKETTNNIYSEPLTIVANSGAKSDLEDWLSNNNIEINWTISEDTSRIESGDFDLYIVRREQTELYKKALQQQKSLILYDAPTWEQREYLEVTYTKWVEAQGLWEKTEDACIEALKNPSTLREDTLRAINNLEDGKLDIEYSNIDGWNEPDGINRVTGNDLDTDLFNGITNLKNFIGVIDEEDTDIFDSNLTGDRFYKLAILIGDKYRQDIQYPMSVYSDEYTKFYRAYYADSSASYARDINRYQPNLGDFTENLEELLQVSRIDKNITIYPKRFDGWTATGVYAVAGDTIKVKRVDTNNIEVKVKFNMLRVNTTRIWEADSYTRPRYLESNTIALIPNKEYELSTPYGGPIYIYTQGSTDETPPKIEIEFKNVGEHPTLITQDTSFDENKINEYYDLLKNSLYSWTDIKTPFVEIHSLKSKQLDAFADLHYNNDLEAYFYDIKTYLVEAVLKIAGYQGDGLELSQEVQDWCDNNELNCTSQIHQKPAIQHINSDIHAHCGGACSGNPFDMREPVTIFSGGAIHEYGHNLQRLLLKFYGWYSTEVTNNIFTQSVFVTYAKEHNLPTADYKWNYYQEAYDILQDAIRDGVEAREDVHPMWLNVEVHSAAGIRQVLLSHLAFLNGSWEVYTKLYLMERIFEDGCESEEKWDSIKSKLGFDDYNLTEAKELLDWANIVGGNDFMVITLSKIANKDYRDYFRAWGLRISDKANSQLDSTNYEEKIVPQYFLYRDDNDLVVDMPTKSLPLDGARLLVSETIPTLCEDNNASACADSAMVYSFDSDLNVTFKSIFADNGTQDEVTTDIELESEAIDSDGNIITIKFRASKDDELVEDKTSIVVWISKEDNLDLDSTKSYTINYDKVPYIEVYSNENESVINRIKTKVIVDNLKSN